MHRIINLIELFTIKLNNAGLWMDAKLGFNHLLLIDEQIKFLVIDIEFNSISACIPFHFSRTLPFSTI